MKMSNAFEDLGIPISFKVDIADVDCAFQKAINSASSNEDLKLQITKSYSIIRCDILRGEEILKIFNILQESVVVSLAFLEEMMDLDGDEVITISQKIYEKLSSIILSSENISSFAILFMKYKYISKAFL